MVITLHADRRVHHAAAIGAQLANAMAPLVRQAGVIFVASRPQLDLARHIIPNEIARATLHHGSAAGGDVGAHLLVLAGRYEVTLALLAGAPIESVLSALDASDRILLVSDPSVASLRATQRWLRLCGSLGYGLEKVRVLLFDFAEDAPLAPSEAAAVLKSEIFGVIPGETTSAEQRASSYARLAERLTARP